MVERKASLALPLPFFVLLLRVDANRIFEQDVNGINFANVTSALVTDVHVNEIDYDEYIPGNILFSTRNQLFTANIDQQTKSLIIGGAGQGRPYLEGTGINATFSGIFDFYQRTNSSVLLVDKDNNVLRMVDRRNQESFLFAGSPGFARPLDGNLSTCQFFEPISLATFDGVVFYICQLSQTRMAVMNLSTSEGRVTHINIALPLLRFVADIPSSKLIATTGPQILEIDPSNVNAPVILAGSSSQTYIDGPITHAQLGQITYVLSLNGDTLLCTDFAAGVLRVVDLNGQVTSICSGTGSGQHINNCSLLEPAALMRYNSTLILIGTELNIAALFVGNSSTTTSTAATTQTMTTTADLLSTHHPTTSADGTSARLNMTSTGQIMSETTAPSQSNQANTTVGWGSSLQNTSATSENVSTTGQTTTTNMLTMPTERSTTMLETSTMSTPSTTSMPTVPTQRSTVVPEPSAISPTSTSSMPVVPTRHSTVVPEPSAISSVLTTTMSTMLIRRSTVVAASSPKATTRTTTTEGRPRSRISTTSKASLPPVPVISSTRPTSKIRTTIIGIGKSEDNKNDAIYILIVVPLLVILLAAIVWKVRSSRSNQQPFSLEQTETIDFSKQPLQETTIEDKQSTAINLGSKPKSSPPQAVPEIRLDQQLQPTQENNESPIPDELEAKSTTPPKADVENSFDQQLLQAKEKSEHSIPSELKAKPGTPPPRTEDLVYSDHDMQQAEEGEVSFYHDVNDALVIRPSNPDAMNRPRLYQQPIEDMAKRISVEELPNVPTPKSSNPDTTDLSESNFQ